jgi:hypothetical protein
MDATSNASLAAGAWAKAADSANAMVAQIERAMILDIYMNTVPLFQMFLGETAPYDRLG